MADTLSLDEVKHIARLARLRLTPKEEERYRGELNKVLAVVNELNQVEVEGLAPTAQVTGLTNVVRDDQTGATLPMSEALANAPAADGRYFKVPNVL